MPPKKLKSSVQNNAAPSRRRKDIRLLLEMPLDVIYEVFQQCEPKDLLNLSRTSKALRKLLLNKSSRGIWRTSLGREPGLPDCLASMSEPAYTRLLYDNHCHYCNKTVIMGIDWVCRVRVCKPCLGKHFTKVIPPQFVRRIPFADRKDGDYYPKAEVHKMMEDYEKTITTAIENRQAASHISWDEDEDAQFDFAMESDAILDLFKRATEALQDRRALVAPLAAWYSKRNADRYAEKTAARSSRKEAIEKRLRELGYDLELDSMTEKDQERFGELKQVAQPRPLTTKIWNNIRDEMVSFMLRLQSIYALRKKLDFICDRQKVLRTQLFTYKLQQTIGKRLSLPGTADICLMDEFNTILESPRSVQLDESSFTQAFARLPELSKAWRLSKSSFLLDMYDAPTEIKDDPTSEASSNYIQLAINIVYCTNCSCVLSYPNVLIHHCLTSYKRPPDLQLDSFPSDAHYFAWSLNQVPWNFDNHLARVENSVKIAKAVIEACGKDPGVVTAVEMHLARVSLVCDDLECRPGPGCGSMMMSWSSAIDHMIMHHKGSLSTRFRESRQESLKK